MRKGVIAGAVVLTLTLVPGASRASGTGGRLTGHGLTLTSVSSAGRTTEGVRLALDFRATRDRAAQPKGTVKMEATGDVRAIVLVEGAYLTLTGLDAEVIGFTVDFSRPDIFTLEAHGTADLADESGNRTTFETTLTVNGRIGGTGTALAFSALLGDHGDQGSFAGSGAWETPPGATAISGDPGGTDIPNALLQGRYSADIGHSDHEAEHAVFVIDLDGMGGVTGGRLARGNQAQPTAFSGGSYDIDADGLGTLVFYVSPGPQVFSFHIAVFDKGNGAKLALQYSYALVGELRKQ